MRYPVAAQSDPRYHPKKWKHTAKLTKQLTKGRCCICLAKACEVHHALTMGCGFCGGTSQNQD